MGQLKGLLMNAPMYFTAFLNPPVAFGTPMVSPHTYMHTGKVLPLLFPIHYYRLQGCERQVGCLSSPDAAPAVMDCWCR